MTTKQSIATAPKDGSQFLAWLDDGSNLVVSWDDGYSIHGLGGRWMSQDGWTYVGREATHWEPIEAYL
jgi:hypothetical protein